MKKNLDIKNLKEAIYYAENQLKDMESKGKKNRFYNKVSETLDRAYALLLKDEYTQKEIDAKEKKIWKIFEKRNKAIIFSVLLFGFICAGVIIFGVHETYTFMHHHWDQIPYEELHYHHAKLVQVYYKENKIIQLRGQVPVTDEVGLKNPAQEFEIFNNGNLIPKVDYNVEYYIDIKELNQNSEKKLDRKFIKYQFVLIDEHGREKRSEIGTFAELKRNADGTYRLTQNVQRKNGKHTYKVILWVNAIADDREQGKSYIFYFDVSAVLKRR